MANYKLRLKEKLMSTKEIALVATLKLPKELKERLAAKIIDKNDDKIIEKFQQRQSHIEAIKRLDKEIGELTNIEGLN